MFRLDGETGLPAFAGAVQTLGRTPRFFTLSPDGRLLFALNEDSDSIVAFEVEGGREAAFRVIDGTELFSITANLGDAKSTITHPATTTHHRLGPEQRAEAGISEGLIRLSVGLEDWEDLRNDLDQALRSAAG